MALTDSEYFTKIMIYIQILTWCTLKHISIIVFFIYRHKLHVKNIHSNEGSLFCIICRSKNHKTKFK